RSRQEALAQLRCALRTRLPKSGNGILDQEQDTISLDRYTTRSKQLTLTSQSRPFEPKDGCCSGPCRHPHCRTYSSISCPASASRGRHWHHLRGRRCGCCG